MASKKTISRGFNKQIPDQKLIILLVVVIALALMTIMTKAIGSRTTTQPAAFGNNLGQNMRDITVPVSCVSCDLNRDGVLGSADIAQVTACANSKLCSGMDVNGDGKINQTDVSVAKGYLLNYDVTNCRQLDLNNDGTVTQEELRQLTSCLGNENGRIAENLISQCFADTNGDGLINKDDIRYCTSCVTNEIRSQKQGQTGVRPTRVLVPRISQPVR